MTDARWSWRLLRCGAFRLDGGGMFGMIPKVVWSRLVEPDDRNRIPLQTNSLLLERDGKLVVIELGIGDKFGPKERDMYALEDRTVVDALHEAGCRPEDIAAVIPTHLHFDHAGALTRRPRPGNGEPDRPALTFPNAEIIAQRIEWEDAIANRSTMSRTYLREHLTDEVGEQIRLVDAPMPGAAEAARNKHGSASTSVAPAPPGFGFQPVEVLPGIEVFLVPGHTWGQQAVRFTDPSGRTVVFTPDVMPTANHTGAAYNLAYDVEAYVSMRMRMAFLEAATTHHWLLALDHEPGDPLRTVERDPAKQGQYRLVEAG